MASYTPYGTYDKSKAGHPEIYFVQRNTSIDYRGELKISPLSLWGYENMVITASHDIILKGSFTQEMRGAHVFVDDYAWITSRTILYNCHIMTHAIVAVGAVVSNMIVQPYNVVAGNPAVVIAMYDLEKKRWRRP